MSTSTMITALAATTSVGLDAMTTCASIRAGLSRPEIIEEQRVLDIDIMQGVGLTGHPVATLSYGFCAVGRWLQLAAAAIDDLLRHAELPGPGQARFWSTTQWYFALPILDLRRFITVDACTSDEALEAAFLPPLRERLSSRCCVERATLLTHGRQGVFQAIELAGAHFEHGHCERVIVLAVDSLLDAPALGWLEQAGRLKQDENPVGLMPGEAAVGFMLEPRRGAQARGARALGRVGAVACEKEPKAFMAGDRSIGEALARAIDRALTQAQISLPYATETITDLNGEVWRAEEFGHAQVRVPRERWSGGVVELPASSVGDIGVAMPALQLVIACRSLMRRYAGGEHVLLTSSDAYGGVGAACICKGE